MLLKHFCWLFGGLYFAVTVSHFVTITLFNAISLPECGTWMWSRNNAIETNSPQFNLKRWNCVTFDDWWHTITTPFIHSFMFNTIKCVNTVFVPFILSFKSITGTGMARQIALYRLHFNWLIEWNFIFCHGCKHLYENRGPLRSIEWN